MEEHVLQYIEDGMVVGLGSGTTMNRIMEQLALKMNDGLQIIGVPTSLKTEKIANELGIPLLPINEVTTIDLAIDGANEIDDYFNAIKGGGGSLVREKIIDYYAKKLILVADEKKKVIKLGNIPVPVEVIPFGWEIVANHYIKQLGGNAVLRTVNDQIFISDNGNYILDCYFGLIADPFRLHEKLIKIAGIVETGLFTNNIDKIILYNADEVRELNKGASI